MFDVIQESERKEMQKDPYIASNGTKRLPLSNEVANRIVEKIRSATFSPGSRLPSELELAEEFGVSRGTVREAVKLLVSKNVLEIRPAKGTFVRENPGMSEDPLGLAFMQNHEKMIRDLLDLRILLECYAVKNAAMNASEEQIACMKELADKIDAAAGDNTLCTIHDIELHKCIAESSGNIAISTVLPVIRSNMEHFNSLDFEREWGSVNAGHRAIIAAIEQHNPMLAEAETVKHLSYVTDKLDKMRQKALSNASQS